MRTMMQLQVHLKSRPMSASIASMSELLTIGELSARSGVASSALRFYEERGLISSERAVLRPPPLRAPRDQARRLHRLRAAGRAEPRRDRSRARKLPADRVPNRRDWAKLSSCVERPDRRAHRRARAPKAGLTECIGCGCLSLDRCKLANPDDRASRARARPALLDRRSAPGVTTIARRLPSRGVDLHARRSSGRSATNPASSPSHPARADHRRARARPPGSRCPHRECSAPTGRANAPSRRSIQAARRRSVEARPARSG